ncbi:MAG: hypothetical protein ACD_12C00012G0007 [uncultured bacterium]|nr:MAG: hypothetical protein ACD_12C00012G0007 [uncultured bacterium]
MSKKEREERKANSELTYDFFESNFKDVLGKNPLLATKIDAFMRNVSQKYQPIEANLIRRAIVIGAVAHQNNEIEIKRFRKAGNGHTNPIPYFIHPIEMAECMIPTSKDDPTFDWITIVATLLHDVPEDVRLKGVEGKEAWLSTIAGIFKDTGKQDLLTKIIDGVTERKLSLRNTNSETEKLYQRLEKAPMYGTIVRYITSGGNRHMQSIIKQIDPETKKSVYEVVYNLEHLFLSATHSPEELRIFFIKIADVWHNLQSSEWVKNTKVLRGRMAAGLAELLGWNLMRDKIIFSLAKITDVSTPFSSHIGKNKTLFYDGLSKYVEEEKLADLNIVKQIIPHMMLNYPKSLAASFKMGFPIPHSDTINPLFTLDDGEITTLPQPIIDVILSNSHFENFLKDFSRFSVSVNDSRSKSRVTNVAIKPKKSLMIEALNLLGRQQIEFIVKPGNRNSFTVRIENDQPHIIDMFTSQVKQVIPSQIPELGLLNSNFTLNDDLLSTHIQALIGFCYEINLIGQAGEGIVPVFHRASNRLFFLPNTLTVQEVSEICGIPELKASYSGKVLRELYTVAYKQALKRIIEV